MRRAAVRLIFACLLLSLAARPAALTHQGVPASADRRVSLPAPVRLERWRNGWRLLPAPGGSLPDPPPFFTQLEPGGKRVMLLLRVPGGRVTPRSSEVELYLADLRSGLVRPVAAPGLVGWNRWSPGGRWYSFGVGATVDADLWLLDAEALRLMRLSRGAAADHRWLRPGLLLHYVTAEDGLGLVGVDLAGGRRLGLALPGQEFRGMLSRDQSVVTVGRSRQVYLRPAAPAAPLSAPLPLGPTAPKMVRVSPEGVFVNTVAVAEGGRRLVYAFTRSRGIPGGANTLYVDSLGIYTADGQAAEMALGFRADLRDGDLTLSPDGRYLMIDYVNSTDEPAQGLYLYDLDERRLIWQRPKRGMSPHLIGWEAGGPVVMDCSGDRSGCTGWRVTPSGRLEGWVPSVSLYHLAGEGWAWRTVDAWWFKSPGRPARRLPLSDLPPGADTAEPPFFDRRSGLVKLSPAGSPVEYLLPTRPDRWQP